MKKLFFTGALALFSLANAQGGFNVGAHVGLPLGGLKASSFAAGLDLAYRFEIIDDKLFVGPAIGYQAMLGKEVDYVGYKYKYGTTSVIPITASAVYKFTDQFGAGLDVGYGVAFGGDVKEVDYGSGWKDYDTYWTNVYGSYYSTALGIATSTKGAVLWAPKVYYYFGKASVWAGFQGLSLSNATGTFNVGFSFSFK